MVLFCIDEAQFWFEATPEAASALSTSFGVHWSICHVAELLEAIVVEHVFQLVVVGDVYNAHHDECEDKYHR